MIDLCQKFSSFIPFSSVAMELKECLEIKGGIMKNGLKSSIVAFCVLAQSIYIQAQSIETESEILRLLSTP